MGNILFSDIKTENDFMKVGENIFNTAVEGNFINQYASFLAIETEQQLQDLRKYSNENDKYDSYYDNHEIIDTIKYKDRRISQSNFSLSQDNRAIMGAHKNVSFREDRYENQFPFIKIMIGIFFIIFMILFIKRKD